MVDATSPATPRYLMTRPEVKDKAKCSDSTLDRWMATADFPRPIYLGPRTTRWWSDEVDAWLEQRPRTCPTPKRAPPLRGRRRRPVEDRPVTE